MLTENDDRIIWLVFSAENTALCWDTHVGGRMIYVLSCYDLVPSHLNMFREDSLD